MVRNSTALPAAPAVTAFDLYTDAVASTLTTYYTPLLVILGIIGNTLSIYVFYAGKLRIQSTSLYLSVLAISDTVFLLQLLPPWLNTMQITNLFHRRGFCQVFVYIFYASCCLSAWLVVAFTIERFVAVRYPLRRNSMCTVARAKTVIGLLTIFAMMTNLPVIKYASSSMNDCNIDSEYQVYAERFNFADTIVSFSLPLLIVVCLNVMIIWRVWRQECEQRALQAAQAACPELGARPQRPMPPLRSQQRVTRMLLVVSTVFVVLNLPAYTMRLLAYAYEMNTGPYSGRWAAVNQLALMFFHTNFGINFLLYCLSGQNFRRELCRSIPCLRNRTRRTDDMQLVSRNTNRAGSVTASYVSATEASTSALADDVAAQRRHRSEPFLDLWRFNNSRPRSIAQASAHPDIVQHAVVAPRAEPEDIKMQELGPAVPAAGPAF